MVEIGGVDRGQLVEAVLLWTGFGSDFVPRRNRAAVALRFGADAASRLVPIVEALEADFFSSDARETAADLVEMGDLAALHFRQKYPDIDERVVQAFVWCYIFTFK